MEKYRKIKNMKKFEEWLKEKHPEALEEGWAKNLALGGTLLGAGFGIGQGVNKNSNPNIYSNSVTSPDAASYIDSGDYQGYAKPNIPSSSVTSPDVRDYDVDNNKNGWNSQIGKFQAFDDGNGNIIFRTKNGDYKKVKNVLGKIKFVRT